MQASFSSFTSFRDIFPVDAWAMLKEKRDAFFIDVRSEGEWQAAGVADLSATPAKTMHLSWQFYPSGQWNDQFVPTLETNVPEKNTPLFFLCKVGGRSAAAADMCSKLGYTECYNIAHGFEGPQGWMASGLPVKPYGSAA